MATDLFTQLQAILGVEITYARDLLALIDDESRLLDIPDHSQILSSVEGKNQLLDQLQKTTTTRLQLMADHGYPASQPGIADCLACAENREPLASMFAELTELAEQCRAGNQLAAQLTNRRTHFLANALQILQHVQLDHTETYQRDGNLEPSAAIRNLHSA